MIIYILLFLLGTIGICLSSKYQKQILPFWIFILFLFIGFRYEIGADWGNYLSMFERIKNMSFNNAIDSTDIGYAILNYYSFEGIDGMILVNIICAFIFCLGLYCFCKTLKYPMFSILIALGYFIFSFAMGYTRQAASMGFVLMALPQLIKNRNKRFFILIILGCFFHFTAIVTVIFYLYRYMKKNFLQFMILFIIIMVMTSYFLYSSIISRIALYTEGTVDSKGSIVRQSISLIAAILFFINRKKFKNISPYYDLMSCLSILSIFLFLLSFIFSTIADRIGLYTIILQIMIFPLFASFYKLQLRSLISIMIILFYFSSLMIWLLYSPWAKGAWIPYKNYLFL